MAALTLSDTISRDIGIDDVESDLNLIPEGYVLNTKYDNFNEKFARIRSLESIFETPPDDSDVAPAPNDDGPDVETGIDADVDAGIETSVGSDVKTGS